MLAAAAKTLGNLRPAELLGRTAAKTLGNLRPSKLLRRAAAKTLGCLGSSELLRRAAAKPRRRGVKNLRLAGLPPFCVNRLRHGAGALGTAVLRDGAAASDRS
ncbi:MAG: hypothetical protein WA184_22755, partial [Stellaceae bacterium]